jgi:SAM-dependent methyltransferase
MVWGWPATLLYCVVSLPPGSRDMHAYYARGREVARLVEGAEGLLERVRTEELLERFLPPPPSVVLDVGGGPGHYAVWLAEHGYEVHLVDPVPLHVDQATRRSSATARPLASVRLGDARSLGVDDDCASAVLLLGPLYHLTRRDDRVSALREAKRALRPGGVVLCALISRFASALDGLTKHLFDDPVYQAIVRRDLAEGQHRNGCPTARWGCNPISQRHICINPRRLPAK